MKLHQARYYAVRIAKWLEPFCHRIEIAGSIRRRRPNCNDVDIVCIPKLVPPPLDLLGQPAGEPRSLLREFLVQYVERSEGNSTWRSGTEPQPDATNFLLKLPKCDLDVFAANEATWVTRLICRTGSVSHNARMADKARTRGGHWNPQEGLSLDGQRVPLSSEEDFYQALGTPYLKPEKRE